MSKEIQPIFILPEGTQRSVGKQAQRNNIMAAKLVAETVRTTLGPKGMDKMLVDALGDVTVTNDGVTILEEMNIEHPAAKMIVEVAKTQEKDIGDGTTTAVVIAGELLKKAEQLIDQEIHPTVIVKGYRMAAEKAIIVLNNIAEDIDENDKKILKSVALTAMTGKGAETAKEKLANLVVDAVIKIMEKENGNIYVDLDNIKVEKKIGAAIDDSELINGIILDKEKVHSAMPRSIKNAKIALIDDAIEVKNTEIDAKIQITDPSQLQGFLDMEEKMIKDKVDKILKVGANVIFCQKGIDDLAQHFFARAGVFAVRRVKKSDMDLLARATSAKVVSEIKELTPSDIGKAGLVEEIKFGDEGMVYVRECVNPKSVTLLVRAGTEHVADEIKRAVTDALGDVAAALRSGKVVGGAGAPETEVARNLRHFATTLSGREQLAVLAFADAIEVIPRTLAENAGLDPIDVITELKNAHDKGKKWAGINVFTGKVMDAFQEGVIEPLRIKTQSVISATEVANMILRIDDVIASGTSKEEMPGKPPGPHGDEEY